AIILILALPTTSIAFEFNESQLKSARVCNILKSKWISHESSENQMQQGGRVIAVGFDAPNEQKSLVLEGILYGDRVTFEDGTGRVFVDWIYVAGKRVENGDVVNGK